MRIRKNSRLVFNGSSSASSSSSPASFLVCQLNRSPWDVDSFSPQGEWDDSFALNGSLGESLPASDSLPSGESMELSFEYVEKPTAAKRERESGAGEDEIPVLDESITTPFCTRVDGNGWHCQRSAKRGHTLCDYHLSQLYSNKPNLIHLSKKPVAQPPPTAPKRRGRPRKVEAAAASNPYEFYYYSGFGPRWGKRRGGDLDVATKKGDNADEEDDNRDEIHELSSSTQMMSEDDINENDNDNNHNNNGKKKVNEAAYIENVIDEELDYIDDDDDEEDLYGRRRARKPIKARSLKSLM